MTSDEEGLVCLDNKLVKCRQNVDVPSVCTPGRRNTGPTDPVRPKDLARAPERRVDIVLTPCLFHFCTTEFGR